MRLPTALDALSGLRAARWVRESTERQVDRFGPDAQRDQQDRAIEQYGISDTGIEWQVAHSGRTVAGTHQFADMLARAGKDYDVLLVGYVSRFARDLRTAVNARHELHAAGAAILFADDRLLSSDEGAWETWARESVEAEAYSRRLGRRIREGYAAKRRRHADPGGRAPYGFRRVGEPPLLEPDPDRSHRETVERAFALAAAGRIDRDVAQATGLTLYTVRSMLPNPLYTGRLRDGTPTRFPPLVDPTLYGTVQDQRAARTSRRPGRAARRATYLLPMLECAACGQRLIGDSGRYRHRDPCPAFEAAVHQPRRPVRGQHRRSQGARIRSRPSSGSSPSSSSGHAWAPRTSPRPWPGTRRRRPDPALTRWSRRGSSASATGRSRATRAGATRPSWRP